MPLTPNPFNDEEAGDDCGHYNLGTKCSYVDSKSSNYLQTTGWYRDCVRRSVRSVIFLALVGVLLNRYGESVSVLNVNVKPASSTGRLGDAGLCASSFSQTLFSPRFSSFLTYMYAQQSYEYE